MEKRKLEILEKLNFLMQSDQARTFSDVWLDNEEIVFDYDFGDDKETFTINIEEFVI